MIPHTLNGLGPFDCLSAMQKSIRRGLEREAMHLASELSLTSKAFNTMVCNRLRIIAHEDIGLIDPMVPIFVSLACQQAMDLYDPKKPGKALLPMGNAIRFMCRSRKSREGDHFVLAVASKSIRGTPPGIPEWAYDMHTRKGKAMGHGVQHFRTVSAVCVPSCPGDEYEKEAYAEMKLRRQGETGKP